MKKTCVCEKVILCILIVTLLTSGVWTEFMKMSSSFSCAHSGMSSGSMVLNLSSQEESHSFTQEVSGSNSARIIAHITKTAFEKLNVKTDFIITHLAILPIYFPKYQIFHEDTVHCSRYLRTVICYVHSKDGKKA
ncbi:MAG: hypothetical protein PHQ72_01050 [Hespellia sp.]|nr:hypothetical protein [Hespellia sp.]